MSSNAIAKILSGPTVLQIEDHSNRPNTEVTVYASVNDQEFQDTVDDDYEFARRNLIAIINTAQDSLNEMRAIADQSQHPKAYEVISSLVSTIASANKELLDLSTKRAKMFPKAPQGDVEPSNGTTVNQLFVGSTAELQKVLEEMNKKKLPDGSTQS